MHELSLVASMFETLLEQARLHKARRITGVRIQVGALAGVVPELLESAFDSYKKGTIADGAVLTIVKPPFTIRCRACGDETVREDFALACPACASTDLEIVHGMELVLEKIEMETDDPLPAP
ncbi:MAG: hydrogenase maturation nickel metallochaperone HypA [Acidobacteriota bacterium]|nr:hydrogenase maturation nickel metallochaperone HypA [Acidobacteriota bacterium]OQB57759.1 MAG: Hydrogenase/urease nickel incorporation protein HypA [Candidatus Aminicenantes bacterium ADurb.Bin147]HNQ80626.1 hydrogenase maturation nickel metallochaperone HypA [Candidatus Aminicenantes bacterium]MDD8010376.1 hydrogenase maturation nickel metallochaperone HypA [Acidobacteriota bacterium]MDD8029156.1 hydrogenase maturation nickel metallochaperone HypA [Acidobacteriota bacterium]